MFYPLHCQSHLENSVFLSPKYNNIPRDQQVQCFQYFIKNSAADMCLHRAIMREVADLEAFNTSPRAGPTSRSIVWPSELPIPSITFRHTRLLVYNLLQTFHRALHTLYTVGSLSVYAHGLFPHNLTGRHSLCRYCSHSPHRFPRNMAPRSLWRQPCRATSTGSEVRYDTYYPSAGRQEYIHNMSICIGSSRPGCLASVMPHHQASSHLHTLT